MIFGFYNATKTLEIIPCSGFFNVAFFLGPHDTRLFAVHDAGRWRASDVATRQTVRSKSTMLCAVLCGLIKRLYEFSALSALFGLLIFAISN